MARGPTKETNAKKETKKNNLKVQNREAYKITFVRWVESKLKWKWRRMLSSSARTIASDGGVRIRAYIYFRRRNVWKKIYMETK